MPTAALASWPLPGCRPDSLADLFSARTVAELARMAGAAGGAVALELGGHTLRAPAGRKPELLCLLEGGAPPAGLRSLALRNGTLALRPGTGLMLRSSQPLTLCLERVKITRPAPSGGSGAGGKAARVPEEGTSVVTFGGEVRALVRACRVELAPGGPAGDSVRQAAVGVRATDTAQVRCSLRTSLRGFWGVWKLSTVVAISIRSSNFGWARPNRVVSQAVFQKIAAGHPMFGSEREVRASTWGFVLIATDGAQVRCCREWRVWGGVEIEKLVCSYVF
jgi:hypothetical protein